MKKSRKFCLASLLFLGAFVLWTVLVCLVDVAPIGPGGTRVGFASLNRAVHGLTGVHMALYTVTDWLGLVPLGVVLAFAVSGVLQWARRRSLLKVDLSLLLLGAFYLAVLALYLLFEVVVVNYRPILIEGRLEVSYPSSTTLLVLCVMPTALMRLMRYLGKRAFRCAAVVLIVGFMAFMVLGRLLSGVHWVSDIIGGGLLSAGLVTGYACVTSRVCRD